MCKLCRSKLPYLLVAKTRWLIQVRTKKRKKNHTKFGFYTLHRFRVQELCESRGGRPGLPGPNKPYGFCGRKATLNRITPFRPSQGLLILQIVREVSGQTFSAQDGNKPGIASSKLVFSPITPAISVKGSHGLGCVLLCRSGAFSRKSTGDRSIQWSRSQRLTSIEMNE